MGAPEFIALPKDAAPSETIDISIDFIAPDIAGKYKSTWLFEDITGKQFGLGKSSNGQIWTQIEVVFVPTGTPTFTPEPTQTITSTPLPPFTIPSSEVLTYDFITEICSAQWLSVSGTIACPGSANEAQKTLALIPSTILENGTTLNQPAIMANPANEGGFVTGIYPEYQVQPGDRFRAIVGCEANESACSSLFRVSYQDNAGVIADLWAVGEFYDQKNTEINLDLSPLAGQTIKLILDVTSLNASPNNRVLWVAPGIYRESIPTATVTFTPSATPSITPTLTITPAPTATQTPVPQPKAQPSILEQIQKFFNDLIKSIFG